jgi:2-isopropylmalate synthase
VVMALRTRRDHFGVDTRIDTHHIYALSRMVSDLTGIVVQPNKAIVGRNAFAHSSGIHQDGVLKDRTTYEIIDPRDIGVPESEIVLSARSGRHGLRHRLEAFEPIYQRFLALADRKKTVSDRDLEAIVGDQARLTEEASYTLEHVQVSCGTNSMPTATVRLRTPDGTTVADAAIGAGPVDAVYQAINRVVGVPNELIEFAIKAVTEGIDAIGQVTIRIRSDGQTFTGRGADTDIVVASAKAYMNALNRLIAIRREDARQKA